MIDAPILRNTLSYIAGFIFLSAITVYLYLLVEDNRQKEKHSQEETIWIYSFLVILIIGFFASYYYISRSNIRVAKLQEQFRDKGQIQFIGKNPRIPVRGGGPLRNSPGLRLTEF